MDVDEPELRKLIVRLARCIAEDDDGCPYTGRAGRLAEDVRKLLDKYADYVADPDEIWP